MSISIHQDQILSNQKRWERKPLLQRVYRDFHRLIASHLSRLPESRVVELGSGIGNIRDVIPDCLRTDLFPNPWIDQVENAYALSFGDCTVSDLILMDVFHHMEYPGTALAEFGRVLRPGGRVIILDPCMSLLGLLIYGARHSEPVGLFRPIAWFAPPAWSGDQAGYYAGQGNATRIFGRGAFNSRLAGWNTKKIVKLSALAYVASGGYAGPQLYPERALPAVRRIEGLLDRLPLLFATRMLVVLEKRASGELAPGSTQ